MNISFFNIMDCVSVGRLEMEKEQNDFKADILNRTNLTEKEFHTHDIYLWKYENDKYDDYDTVLHYVDIDPKYKFLKDKEEKTIGIISDSHDGIKFSTFVDKIRKFQKYCDKIDRLLSENQGWEFIYSIENFSKYNTLGKKGKWYMTFGGGPEGGYYYDAKTKELFSITRTWGAPFTFTKIDGKHKLRRNKDNKDFFEIKIIYN